MPRTLDNTREYDPSILTANPNAEPEAGPSTQVQNNDSASADPSAEQPQDESAADIAVDAARRALEVRWSVRTGHWVVPRHIAGMPGDVAASREPAMLGKLNDAIAQTVIGRVAGDPSDVGLPKPAVSVLEDAVIISDEVLERIREGSITPIGTVKGVRADGKVV